MTTTQMMTAEDLIQTLNELKEQGISPDKPINIRICGADCFITDIHYVTGHRGGAYFKLDWEGSADVDEDELLRDEADDVTVQCPECHHVFDATDECIL